MGRGDGESTVREAAGAWVACAPLSAGAIGSLIHRVRRAVRRDHCLTCVEVLCAQRTIDTRLIIRAAMMCRSSPHSRWIAPASPRSILLSGS